MKQRDTKDATLSISVEIFHIKVKKCLYQASINECINLGILSPTIQQELSLKYQLMPAFDFILVDVKMLKYISKKHNSYSFKIEETPCFSTQFELL